MKKFLGIVLAFTLALSLVACGNGGSAANSKAKVVKIGVFEPQTGENGGGGIQEVYGIRYANKLYPTVNIGGEEYEVQLVEVDNKSDKTEAVNAAQKLIAEKVNVVLGSYGSGVSIAAGDYFKEAHIPAIGCSCTNPQVTSGNEFYFRTCFLDPFQGTVMASYAKNHGYTKAAIITQLGDDYSEGLGSFFAKECVANGIEIVAQEKFQTNEQDFKTILTNIKGKEPQIVFAPSSIATAPLILSQAKELGLDAQFAGSDTWENATIIENAHGAAEGCVLVTFYEANPDTATGEEAKFLFGEGDIKGFSDYLVSIGQPKEIPAVSALGYDAYLGAIKAIEAAQSLNGDDIKNALNTLSYNGVTGNISFDENGDVKKSEAFIKEVKDGVFKFLKRQSI